MIVDYDVQPLVSEVVLSDLPSVLPDGDVYFDSPAFNAVYPVSSSAFDVSVSAILNRVDFSVTIDGITINYWDGRFGRVGFVTADLFGGDSNDLMPVYRLYPTSYNGSDVPAQYEYWLYAFDIGALSFPSRPGDYSNVTGYRLSLAYVNQRPDLQFPSFDNVTPLPSSPGGILTWLYGVGQTLLTDNPLFDLMAIDIGGYDLVTLLLTSGFVIYVGWVVVKWVIP